MSLLDDELRRSLPSLYATEHDAEPMVRAKFFTPWSCPNFGGSASLRIRRLSSIPDRFRPLPELVVSMRSLQHRLSGRRRTCSNAAGIERPRTIRHTHNFTMAPV